MPPVQTDGLASVRAHALMPVCSMSHGMFCDQAGQVMCRRMVCDCDNPNADLFCCPECDPRLSSQCLHQNGLLTYGSGDTWVENCQQCQCLVSTDARLNMHVGGGEVY